MAGNVNLVSYGHFNFPCMHKLRPLDVNCPKMLLFNFARTCEIFVARFQILFKQIVNVQNFKFRARIYTLGTFYEPQ